MIRGYAAPASARPGDRLTLRVSSDAPAFHVVVYRLGRALERLGSWGPLAGRRCPDGPPDEPWDWPPYPLDLPPDWPSGIYLAHLTACRGGEHDRCLPARPPPVDGREARALFVLRRPAGRPAAPLLYKVPLATYHAYNASGGGSLYVGAGLDPVTGRRVVTVERAGGGTGGELSFPDAVDVYDPGTPREGVAHWDAPFVAWLEHAGYAADYCTDLDLHADPGLLDGHRALLSVGHDEYWSSPTRRAIERFVAAGGHAAFFSGNVCFWRIEVSPDGRRISCRHPSVASADCDQWWRVRPEAALTGVSYRHGGGWWSGPREPLGYTVADPGHWAFTGTGLRAGQELGAAARLVGYECDGAPLDPRSERPRAAGGGGVPPDFHVLAVARLGAGWQERPDGAAAAATMGVHVPGGVVFTAATTDWPRVLAAGDAAVDRITRNVLGHLRLPGRRLHAPAWGRAGDEVAVWLDASGDEPVRWEASAGAIAGDGPVATLRLPTEPGPVTVWATAGPPDRPAGFGTRTLRALAPAESAQLQLLQAVRRLCAGTPPDPAPAVAPEPGNRPLTDPGWEPLRDGLRRGLGAREAEEVAGLARDVVDAAGRLADALGHERSGP